MLIRIKKVFRQFGFFYGIKYLLIYWLHKHCYIKFIGKHVVKLRYKGHPLYVRLFSRDLDFVESIYIGVMSQNGYKGEYDLNEYAECESFLDLGANIGLFSFMYAIKYPTRTIVALEPEEKNFKVLIKNVGDFSNVICLQNRYGIEKHIQKFMKVLI